MLVLVRMRMRMRMRVRRRRPAGVGPALFGQLYRLRHARLRRRPARRPRRRARSHARARARARAHTQTHTRASTTAAGAMGRELQRRRGGRGQRRGHRRRHRGGRLTCGHAGHARRPCGRLNLAGGAGRHVDPRLRRRRLRGRLRRRCEGHEALQERPASTSTSTSASAKAAHAVGRHWAGWLRELRSERVPESVAQHSRQLSGRQSAPAPRACGSEQQQQRQTGDEKRRRRHAQGPRRERGRVGR